LPELRWKLSLGNKRPDAGDRGPISSKLISERLTSPKPISEQPILSELISAEHISPEPFYMLHPVTILRKKYPNTKASVKIEQKGLKVTMIIDPADGDREVIEKELHEYGLVVTGKMSPEEFTDDKLLCMDLQNQLTFAKAQIETV
jgi:hypothetical protein